MGYGETRSLKGRHCLLSTIRPAVGSRNPDGLCIYCTDSLTKVVPDVLGAEITAGGSERNLAAQKHGGRQTG